MEMEVNTGECVSPRRSTGRANKSPRKVRPASGNSQDTEQTDKSGRHEEKGMKTSVLQGKVKALKEKQIKEKEPRHSESRGTSQGDISEDALVSPQLRTYLTEDLLDCHKQDVWGTDELWETCNISGSSLNYYSSCQTENVSNSVPVDENSSQFCPHDCLHSSCDNPCSTPCTTGDPHCSLSLAERVERNRLELRCKLNRTACHSVDNTNGDLPSQGHVSKDVSWLFPSETDADSGVSIPIIDDGRELSVRHEQAKQLLHRARMKAKGASPLRASHCVLPHPHSQPSLRRGPSAPGVVTDGGSQSDSSSSDYYSWHKGSRGSSPSHVRFQDESERDVQERYRERQHVPQTSLTNTPPPKRQANGSPSWTDQLSPSGHGQCGTCGSNIKASGASPAAIHGTNLRNVHLGSKITQDGSLSSTLGVKPSPHWILPSQPWRVHTELIRETHIGGDSTADSSGEEEGSRTLGNKNQKWGIPKFTPEHGATLRTTHSFSDGQTRAGGSYSEQAIKVKNGTSVFALESRFKDKAAILEPNSILKMSELNPQVSALTGGSHVDSVRTGLTQMPQDIETKLTRKSKCVTLDTEKGINTLHTEIETRNIVLNLDSRQGTTEQTKTRDHAAPIVPCMPYMVSQSDSGKMQRSLSNRVPIPPPGKAPTVVLSRNGRLAVRTESVHQQLLQGGNKVPVFQDKKGIQSDLVPNSKVTNPDVPGDIDNHHLSTASMKVIEPKFGEALPSSKKPSEERKSKEAKENKSSGKKHVKREPREHESSHAGNRHVHCERYNSTKELHEPGLSPKVSSHSREENEGIFLRKEKCTEKSKTNGQQAANNERTGSGPVIATKDRCMELAHDSKVQSEVKKGDIRSGMRKIFSSIGLTSRPKLERFQSSSLEQITPPELHKGHASANGENESSEKLGTIKKSPSLQSLKLMSPFNLPRRASSVQNLLGKSDRSAAYITGEANTAPRRALSVEDIGSPGMARALGKVAEVYPDGTRLLELHCLEKGGFGFSISSGNGRPDSGIYVQDMSDVNTAKLYSGLLRVGDEILEVNGAKVSTLGLGQLKDILLRESVLSLRVLHQRRTKC
ncbi:uncharacterized protein KIAA1614 homolog [Bufo bufo]|uniref:uncharacterized protein KIAA1614 homolog n=1 Tax=Bufo bufo TaxID=8384 RepID=UPI001ABDE461|nr:uncharacterized protein KIAA1614 homolog [Bufo bufo]